MKKINTISEFNQYMHLPKPLREDIDVGYYDEKSLTKSEPITIDFYRISIKQNLLNRLAPDYNPKNPKPVNGVFFMSPKMELAWDIVGELSGMYIHISKEIIENHRHLFQNCLDYGLHEALIINSEEEKEINELFEAFHRAYHSGKDQHILISHIYLLISYVESFYHRQFNTERQKYNQIVSEFQQMVRDFYKNEDVLCLPSVQYFADKMKITPNYLGDVVRYFTQKSAISFIHDIILERAKFLLQKTTQTNAEIAYALGFEYPSYFAKFFKKHTGINPKEFRKNLHL